MKRAEDLGLLDARLLDVFEAKMVVALSAGIDACLDPTRDCVGSAIAESVFGSCSYANGLDRQLAVACGAAADLAVDEAIVLALHYAVFTVSDQQLALRPASPVQGSDRS